MTFKNRSDLQIDKTQTDPHKIFRALTKLKIPIICFMIEKIMHIKKMTHKKQKSNLKNDNLNDANKYLLDPLMRLWALTRIKLCAARCALTCTCEFSSFAQLNVERWP